MIKLIYGPKGFGKTKIIKDDVNVAMENAKGNVIFITDKKTYSVDIDLNVKCIFTEEYDVSSVEAFRGFVQGVVAGNSDIEYVFIDGLKRICAEENLAVYEEFFKDLNDMAKANNVNVELTISAAKEELPKFLLEYVG